MHAGGSDFRALLHDLESRLLAPSWRGALLVKEAIRRAQTPLRSTGEGVVKASSASTPLSPHPWRRPGTGFASVDDGWVIEGLALPCLYIHFPPVTRSPSTVLAVLGTRAPLPRAVGQVSAEEIELGR